ncbi:MAG: hypothetical protein K6E59_06520 [Bacilli bacterium]|nr:hypothetical protein [Bacilli bacterium]
MNGDDGFYIANASGSDGLVDKSLYSNVQTTNPETSKIKISKKAKLTAFAATLVAGVLGVGTIVNPLVTKPSIKNGSYSVVDTSLNYHFKLSTTSNYKCSLIFLLEGETLQTIELPKAQAYDGSIAFEEHGEYVLNFFSTNNFDYSKTQKLYSFTY